MDRQTEIVTLLSDLKDAAPAGYAIALHIRFATPLYLFQTYPRDWIEVYSRRGFVMRDPTVVWGLEHTGAAAWRDLKAADPAGILDEAGKFGLRHGVTIATTEGGSRSIASFARGDRDLDADETARLVTCIDRLHALTADAETLSDQTREMLRRMSITFTHP